MEFEKLVKEKPDDRQRPEDNKSNSASNQPGQEQGEAAQAAARRGQMTKEQVEKLLDAQKGDEKAMIFQPSEKGRARARVFKDW